MKSLNTVNVIVQDENFIVNELISFTDGPGNGIAEAIFEDKVRKLNPNVTKEEIEDALDCGTYQYLNMTVIICHSNRVILMIEVNCKTNLDLRNEKWPDEMPAVPNVGDTIVSRTKWKHFQLQLEVHSITWEYSEMRKKWVPTIELHMTKWQKKLPAKKEGAADGSIVAFYEWYAPLVGSFVGAFI